MQLLTKNNITLFISCLIFCFGNANATAAYLKISGKQAKSIYISLTGPAVHQEGAAGHSYREGKSILCRYTNADMDDSHGNAVSSKDPIRYACSIKFNKNGHATPGNNP